MINPERECTGELKGSVCDLEPGMKACEGLGRGWAGDMERSRGEREILKVVPSGLSGPGGKGKVSEGTKPQMGPSVPPAAG